MLSAAGTVQSVDDIRSAKWMKLVSQRRRAGAVGDPQPADARDRPHARGCGTSCSASGYEASRTAVALGHRVVPIFGLTDDDPDDHEGFVDDGAGCPVRRCRCSRHAHDGATRLDEGPAQRGRRNQRCRRWPLDGRFGTAHATNAVIVEVAHRIERHEVEPAPENLATLRELADHHSPVG